MQIGSVAKRIGLTPMLFGSTSAMNSCHARHERRGASACTMKAMLKRWPSYAAYRAWDSKAAVPDFVVKPS
jgi:hypothetical protein